MTSHDTGDPGTPGTTDDDRRIEAGIRDRRMDTLTTLCIEYEAATTTRCRGTTATARLPGRYP
jgi:hypothetical protein